jgi:hypothetical protein
MILLTAQMQSQSGEPSVLQNPHVLSILQQLVNNTDKNTNVDTTELLKDPSLASVFKRPALLDTPKSRPILLNNPVQPQQPQPQAQVATPTSAEMGGANYEALLNAQNLSQLLGSLSATPTNGVAEVPKNTQQVLQPTVTQPLLPTPPNNVVAQAPPPQQAQATPTFLMGYQHHAPFFMTQQAPPHQQQFYVTPPAQFAAAYQGFTATPMGTPASYLGHMLPPTTLVGSYAGQPQVYTSFATPPPPPIQAGSKRRLTIPPSPENSPDGPYVGQHSQGLGGHYASSYVPKKAKKY